ncbi:hypothetical protein ACJ41O_010494 [Fusarium nematophilum]
MFNPSDFDLSPGMFLDLDLLDYGILDGSLMMLDDRGPTGSVTTASVNETLDLPDTTPPDYGGRQGEDRGAVAHDLPKGMRLMRISPLDAHRTQLLQYLQESPLGQRRWDRWLSTENMSRYLNSYFSFFHRHTPLLHLPSWNISTTSTRLLFSMLLMGALYSEDLNSQSATDRQLCQVAQTFAWDTDPGLPTSKAQLDTIQAVYIATLVEAFYFPAKRHRATVDTKRLLAEARRSGIFSPNRALKEPWKMGWDEWSLEESRKRTAFILYLFDAIQAIFFEQQPDVQLHELRLPLPCDESIYSAETEEEWRELSTGAQDLAKVEYPVLLALFLSHRPLEIALNLSVMGAFIVLHGILLHVWEQQSIHKRDDPTDVPDEAEKSMREHLSAAQAQAADNALQLWLRQWNKSVSRPASTESHGLYRDRALVYWFLGNLMNQCPGSDVPESPAPLVNGRWKMRIPGLLRRLAILVDSGQLNSTNGAVTSVVRERSASYLGDLDEGIDTDAESEGMDTITMSAGHLQSRVQVSASGTKIPAIGLGAFEPGSGGQGRCRTAVKEGILAGYRHVDTAAFYGCEEEVGQGIRDSGVLREDLFVCTKFWQQYRQPNDVAKSLEDSLDRLNLDYAFKRTEDYEVLTGPDGKPVVDEELSANHEPTWRAMEALVRSGKTRSIGVSNFTVAQLTKLLSFAEIRPACNQVEAHPWFPQNNLLEFCKEKGVVFVAYSPLGSQPGAMHAVEARLLDDQDVAAVAEKNGIEPAQVLISWALQRGTVAIPKSACPNRIKSNFNGALCDVYACVDHVRWLTQFFG